MVGTKTHLILNHIPPFLRLLVFGEIFEKVVPGGDFWAVISEGQRLLELLD